MRCLKVAGLVSLVFGTFCYGGEWPQFLGPQRNGTSLDAVAASWNKQSPKVLWKKPVGDGFAGPAVSGNTVILFHRQGSSEILTAFDASTGERKWENKEPTQYRDDFGFDEGPRAVPCVDDGRIYAMGAEGIIRCVDFTHGKTLWSVPTKSQFNAQKGFFGMACSPLVFGDLVIMNIGGESGAGIVALDKNTAKLRWKARQDEASYSSPVIAPLGGQDRIVAFTREAVSILDPRSGSELSEFPWRARMHASVNAATPLVTSNRIFVTASYGAGGVLLRWEGNSLKKVWSNDDSLSSHYATPVLHQGYLYGFHGRQESGPSLRCVELQTGRVMWNSDRFGAGTITLAGDQLLILRESGELVLAKASPARFEQMGNVQIVGSGARAYPALSEKRFYARDKKQLVCLELP